MLANINYMIYTIYKGLKPNGQWKIGCDQDYPNRPIQQSLTDYYILEQYEDIMVASKREIELQKEHNVRVDRTPYWKTKINASKAAKNSLRNGTHNFQNGHGRSGWVSKEVQLKASKKGGLAQKGIPKPHASELAKALNTEWYCEICNKSGKGRGNYVRYHSNCGYK